MFPDYARKFAAASIRLFGHEGRFEIDLPHGLDLEEVAQEYESYGHRVERNARDHRLCILCAARVAQG